MPPEPLRSLAAEPEATQVDQDIHTDNDPRENAGHAQWQRRPFGGDPGSVEPVTSTVYMALVDDPPSLASNVSKLLLAVLILVVGFGVVDGVPETDDPGLLSELCPLAQRESVARLVDDDLPLSAVRLRLAWRERWLVHTGTVA